LVRSNGVDQLCEFCFMHATSVAEKAGAMSAHTGFAGQLNELMIVSDAVMREVSY